MILISSGFNSQPEENIPRAAKMADMSGGALMLELGRTITRNLIHCLRSGE